jgi:TRAP transporter TAXI family solute receptor
MVVSAESMQRMLRIGLLFGLVCGTASMPGCTEAPPEPPRTTITFATGRRGFAAEQLGRQMIDVYAADFRDIDFVVHPDRAGSLSTVQNLRLGTADIGFAQADTAYLAYKRSSAEFRSQLRGMAVLRVSALQLIVRNDSGIRSVSQFRGRRLSVGEPGGPSEVAARIILESYGLTPDDVRFLPHDDLTMSDIAQRISDKRTDVAVVSTSFPVPTIAASLEDLGIEVVPLEPDKITWIRTRYPFYEPILIPAGTYPGQQSAIATIGVNVLLVCRDSLPEELVYRLTKSFFDALPRLRGTPSAAQFIEAEQGPATSIPLHAGAARFYRERELTQ